MSARHYAVVWIDHREADVFHLNETQETKFVVNSHNSVQRLHHQSHRDASGRPPVDTEFFVRIVSALNHTAGTLIAGPGEAKFEFERYLRRHRPDLAAHVHDIDTVDHPSDDGLIALAREHFRVGT